VELAAGHDHPPLPADTLDRLAAFTDLVATAIANSDARAETERLAEEQAALRRVATLVAQGGATEEVFAAVAREVSEVMHLPFAAVQRFEEDGETATMVAAWSNRPHPFQPGTSGPVHRSGLAARVRQTGRAGRTEDYSNQLDVFAGKAREMGLYSVAAAPIIVDGAVWGLVTIASTDGLIPDHAEDRLAEFTELLGTAIANTQSRAELAASRARIVAAADETQRQLERDLHDGIQSRLVALALKARTIETMTPRPADDIQRELSLLADGLGTSVDELREISRGIHPAILSEAGLGPALTALARRSAVRVKLNLNLGARPGKVEPALTSQHDVHQHDLRPQFSCSLQRLSGGSGTADHTQALPFQQNARSLKKQPVVVHNQDTERHTDSVPARSVPRIAASSHPKNCVLG